MRVATGKVVGGKIVVEGTPLQEGAVVTVLSREGDETFELTQQQEAELLQTIEEAERGDTISAEQCLDPLRPRG